MRLPTAGTIISLTLHGAAASVLMSHPHLLSGGGGHATATGSTMTVSIVVDSLTDDAPVAQASLSAIAAPTEPTPAAAAPSPPERVVKSDDAPQETKLDDATLRAKAEPDVRVPEQIVAPAPVPATPASAPPTIETAVATALIDEKKAPPAIKAAASASQGDMIRYAGKIRSRLAAKRPAGIGRKGRVVVTFTIGPDGAVETIEVIQTSGSPRLDRMVLASIRKASPFPTPPERANAGQRTFAIPFDFR